MKSSFKTFHFGVANISYSLSAEVNSADIFGFWTPITSVDGLNDLR